jgi:hypothetical protein
MTARDGIRTPRIEVLDEAIVEVLRRKTPLERVAMVFDAEQTLLAMLGANLRESHPDWTEVNQEIARRRRLESS